MHQHLRKQHGMSLGGLVLLLLLLAFMAYAAARIVPAYTEYWTLRHALANSLETLPGQVAPTARGIRERFGKELRLNNIESVSVDDLALEATATGFKATVEYRVQQPFWRQIHLCLEFKAEAESP